MQLSTFRDGFSAALLGPAVDAPWLSPLESQPGFAVYRNTVLKGCNDALQNQLPPRCASWWVTTGSAPLQQCSPAPSRHVTACWWTMARALPTFWPGRPRPPSVYLPAVARPDRRWTECHLAADATAVDRHWLAHQTPDTSAPSRTAPPPRRALGLVRRTSGLCPVAKPP